MGLLKSKGKLVGAHLSSPVINYLELYTTAYGVTKTSVLRTLLDEFYSTAIKTDTEEHLVKLLISKSLSAYKVLCTTAKVSVDVFCSQLKLELIAANLEEYIINQILTGVKNGTDK